MRKLIWILVVFPLISGSAYAIQMTLLPETWYEIYNPSTTDILSIKPETMRVGRSGGEARSFWEFSLLDINSQLKTIDSAFITFRSIGNKEDSIIDAYEADLIPTVEDWNNDAFSIGNKMLNWSNTTAVGVLSTENLDITEWLIYAIENEFSYFGIMAQAHHENNTVWFNAFLPEGEIVITGSSVPVASVPDASIMLLLGSSLMVLAVFSRKSKRS